MFFFHSVSILLFSSFTWYATTEGTFQDVLKVSASSVLTDLTKKSLNKCHRLSPGASGSACATIHFVSRM
jgi:hypothetical protein